MGNSVNDRPLQILQDRSRNTVSIRQTTLRPLTRPHCDKENCPTEQDLCLESYYNEGRYDTDDGTDDIYVIDNIVRDSGLKPSFRYVVRWYGYCKTDYTTRHSLPTAYCSPSARRWDDGSTSGEVGNCNESPPKQGFPIYTTAFPHIYSQENAESPHVEAESNREANVSTKATLPPTGLKRFPLTDLVQ